ncbi:hypothetical protein PAE9249_00404 [Paenibacillus sp. CECT 9249]|uniref:glycoside hydrolase family 15 protein n=1 Tax=Paenibacillus sp. CECT 9249 TaxID=2845385 RepID=UPI001E2D446E|nr:glycoside hydrolase family 15 protein [Paenibacillus sp. CECT 9249]CAH0117939.1 hypothetical protein PAE9249_00404 [Paenibacillus sp. CECT 9249]
MPRHLVVGNGKLLVNLDRNGYIRDIYFPYVGQLNHVGGYLCRVGCWADGRFTWLEDPEWDFRLSYADESLVTSVSATHPGLELTLRFNDGVHQRDCIYLKKITAINHSGSDREIRLFFHQDLVINETEVGDTAVFYPFNRTVYHYKKNIYFMFNGRTGEEGIYQFSTGIKRFHQAEGTWKDAEDGHLMGNPIAQGSVDSTISFRTFVPSHAQRDLYYWFAAGHSLEEVKKLDAYVRDSGPDNLLNRVMIYWQRWVNKTEWDFADLNEGVAKLFKHSLLMIRAQSDANGAVIAANDTDILQYNRDHYSYMWPRDGALIALAMSMAGYHGTTAPFYRFCADALTPEGCLQHKYNPDGTVGSSWHPYWQDGNIQLPIQEDETALVLYALWKDYERHGDIELPQSLYRSLIRPAANFLCEHMDPGLGLPLPSYDLWEERYGIFAFTAAAVYGGLAAAADFSSLFGDDRRAQRYRNAAENVKSAMLRHLWNEEHACFARGLYRKDGSWVQDMTPESSIAGIFRFGVLPASDERMAATMERIRRKLTVQTEVGGIARYYHDYYFQRSAEIDRIPGNPWIICTLWLADYDIAAARTPVELSGPRAALEWAVKHSMESGMLPEQLDPFTGAPVSVAPLTWSHATFVSTVIGYVGKYRALAGG